MSEDRVNGGVAAPGQREKFNRETAVIRWTELQRYFASGRVISVAAELDLVDVACSLARDEKKAFARWLDDGLVHPVRDEQALAWHSEDTWVWAVVVKPWVLVQERGSRVRAGPVHGSTTGCKSGTGPTD